MLDQTLNDAASIAAHMADLGKRARAASRVLANASADRKHAALTGAAESIRNSVETILDANAV
ncbi:MAG: gamma-glutamyl-phosphate reductase, partial [Pseudomonadota bacterium]